MNEWMNSEKANIIPHFKYDLGDGLYGILYGLYEILYSFEKKTMLFVFQKYYLNWN